MLLPTLLLGRCISTHTSIHWRPPPENNIKLSFHDSVVSSSQSACAFVIRDCKIGAANRPYLRASMALFHLELVVQRWKVIRRLISLMQLRGHGLLLGISLFWCSCSIFKGLATSIIYPFIVSIRKLIQLELSIYLMSVNLGGTLSLVRLMLLGLGTSAAFLARGASLSNCYFLYKQNLICKLSHTEITMQKMQVVTHTHSKLRVDKKLLEPFKPAK